MDISKLWAVEYSISQGFFQIGKLSTALKINRQAVREGVRRDYLIIYIGNSYKACRNYAHCWRKYKPCPNLHHLYSQIIM